MEPLQDDYIDSGNEEPASYAIVRTQLKRYTVSFFKTQNQLYMIRIEIPNVPDDTIPESDCDIIQIIKEHLLSVLRLTYDHDVSLFPRPIWNFIREGEKPSLHVKIGKIVNPSFDPHLENIRNVFVKTLPLRVQTTPF